MEALVSADDTCRHLDSTLGLLGSRVFMDINSFNHTTILCGRLLVTKPHEKAETGRLSSHLPKAWTELAPDSIPILTCFQCLVLSPCQSSHPHSWLTLVKQPCGWSRVAGCQGRDMSRPSLALGPQAGLTFHL